MSKQNVEVVRAVYDAWRRGEYDAVFRHFDEAIEWVTPADLPEFDGPGVWSGHDGVRRSMATWVGTWADYRFELGELTDLGDHVLAEGWQRGRGRGSGVEVSEAVFSVWTLEAGRITRQRMFRDKAQALAAVDRAD